MCEHLRLMIIVDMSACVVGSQLCECVVGSQLCVCVCCGLPDV